MAKKFFFYDKINGYPLSALAFYNQMNKRELNLHVKNGNKNETKVVLDNLILDWTDECKIKIMKSMQLIEANLESSKNSNAFFRHVYFDYPTIFILVKNKLEFGFPHTNSKYIFFSDSFIKKNEIKKLAETIFHEMIHIYQKFNNNNYFLEKICNFFNFFKINTAFPRIRNSISNPDTFYASNYVFYDKDINKYFYFVLTVENNEMKRKSFEYICKQNTIRLLNYIPSKELRFIQYEHPYEVMACVFSHTLFHE